MATLHDWSEAYERDKKVRATLEALIRVRNEFLIADQPLEIIKAAIHMTNNSVLDDLCEIYGIKTE